jgi:hypothetical protein
MMRSVSSSLTFYLDLAFYSTSRSMVKKVAILIFGLNLAAANAESSWCSGLFEGEPQQQYLRPVQMIQVGWLKSQDDSITAIKGCGQLPRATWTIEPTPEGVNMTQIWVSPPDLGRAVFTDGVDSNDFTLLEGIEVNQTALDSISIETEIGVLIQVPKDQFNFFQMNFESPFRVNIAPGFTNILTLYCYGTAYYGGAYTPLGGTCGFDAGAYNFIMKDMTGLGAVVRADLSTVTVGTSGLTVDVDGDGADFSLQLPEGYPLTKMKLKGANSRYSIKGNVNCTGEYDCYLWGGSSNLCAGGQCFSQLVIDGDIAGNVSINPFLYSQQSGDVLIANVSAQDGCDHFTPYPAELYIGESNVTMAEQILDERFRSNFGCIDGATANAVVEVEPFPCTMHKEDMKTIDVVECPRQSDIPPYDCKCFVPSAAACPTPAPSSPASFGALLRKSTSFGLRGILCYILGVLVF